MHLHQLLLRERLCPNLDDGIYRLRVPIQPLPVLEFILRPFDLEIDRLGTPLRDFASGESPQTLEPLTWKCESTR